MVRQPCGNGAYDGKMYYSGSHRCGRDDRQPLLACNKPLLTQPLHLKLEVV